MKHLLLALLLLLPAERLSAQNELTEYSLRQFTSENGLPQNTVKSIGCDEYGFLWLATESGLLRFDGNNFKQFDKNNTGIATSRILDILRSPDGKTLLAVSNKEELIQIHKGNARKLQYSYYDVFFPSAAKQLRFAPLKRLHRQPGIDSLFFRMNEQIGVMVSPERDVLVWYANDGTVKPVHLPAISGVEELFTAGNAIYRGTPKLKENTLQRITPEGSRQVQLTGDFLKLETRAQLKNCFVETYPSTGQSFLYAGRQLFQVTAMQDGNIDTKLLLSGFDMDEHQIYCVYYDSLHQRIIMGSVTEGLYILDRKRFHPAVYKGPEEYALINVIYDHVALSDSSVLTGTGSVFYTNPAIKPIYRRLPGYNNYNNGYHFTNPVYRSGDGRVWVCDVDSLYLFSKGMSAGLRSWKCPYPRTLAEGQDGRIWIGTDHSGLYVVDPGKAAAPQFVRPTRDRIMSIGWEGSSYLWICTIRHLLRMNARTGVMDTISGLSDKMARGIYIPRPGEVWICTYEDGLFLYYQEKLTHFPIHNYPFLKTVHKILEDDRGFFWMSTNHGIYQARRSDLIAYAASGGHGEQPYFYYYSKESGFLTNEFNGGSQNVGDRLGNGFFSFSSLNGIVFFKPAAMTPELPEGQVILDKLEVDGKEIITGSSAVVLNRHFKTLKIVPVSAYMGNPANLQYEFRLNDETEWTNTYNGAVIFSSLPAGYNNIFIRKKAGFGSGNHIDCQVVLYVPPAWWQTVWFYLSAAAVLVLLIWLIIRVRVRYWKKRSALLEVAVQDRTRDLEHIINDLELSENKLGEQLQFQRMLNENITHDITTPLKYLTQFSRKVMKHADDEKNPLLPDVVHLFEGTSRIYEVVRTLGYYMRERLSPGSSVRRFPIHALIAQKEELFRIAAEERNNSIINQSDPELQIRQNESLIGIVLHNLIDNAIKNTENGQIVVTANADGTQILLRVSDDGKGMDAAQVNRLKDYFRNQYAGKANVGFGLMIIKEIVAVLKLEIDMESDPLQGTVFTLAIPNRE